MDPSAPTFERAYRAGLRPPTQAMNDIVGISKEYQLRLGKSLGMNASDLGALELLMLEGAQSPGELARRMGLSAAAMTTIVDRLAGLGHVTRSPHPTDRRAVVVAATPESVARAVEQVLPVAIAVDAVLDEFEADEQTAIERYLGRVAEVHRGFLPE